MYCMVLVLFSPLFCASPSFVFKPPTSVFLLPPSIPHPSIIHSRSTFLHTGAAILDFYGRQLTRYDPCATVITRDSDSVSVVRADRVLVGVCVSLCTCIHLGVLVDLCAGQRIREWRGGRGVRVEGRKGVSGGRGGGGGIARVGRMGGGWGWVRDGVGGGV